MQELGYADQFSRIFSYLRVSGVSLTRDTSLTALKLIEELLATESTGNFDNIMEQVRSRLNGSKVSLPLLCPMINRGSIRYRDE